MKCNPIAPTVMMMIILVGQQQKFVQIKIQVETQRKKRRAETAMVNKLSAMANTPKTDVMVTLALEKGTDSPGEQQLSKTKVL